MAVQITSADKRFTDRTGKFYVGMTTDEVENKKKTISAFNNIDEDKDGIISYEEMFHKLGRDRTSLNHNKETGTIWGLFGIIYGLLTKRHFVGLTMAGIGTYYAVSSQIKINKLDKKYNEWRKMYYEMETAQTQETA